MSSDRVKRTLSIKGWLDKAYPVGDQISWDDLWMNTASLVSLRARCSRDRVGAVIVSSDNIMLAVGYNGPPAGYPNKGQCIEWCPRAIASSRGEAVDPVYDDCVALHAETNAILRAPRPITGGTIYVNSVMCWPCATTVANSGITRVVMAVKPEVRDRNPERIVAYLTECGVEVVVITDGPVSKYRAIFLEEHGYGPHSCYFCDVRMPWVEVIHHIDGDHSNNDVSNLAPAHSRCHTVYHVSSTGGPGTAPNPRMSVTTKWSRVKPMLTCATCGLSTTPGWLKRHADTTGHDGSAYLAWRAEQDELAAAVQRSTQCLRCGRKFSSKRSLAAHSWRCKFGDNEPIDDEA